MTLKTRLAVAFVCACLFTVGLLLVLSEDAGARPPIPPDVFRAVRAEWRTRPERVKAFDVAWCESRYQTRAQNGQYLGIWQMGEWARATYGHGWTARAQAHAAHLYYTDSGWSGWECA